MREKRQRPSVTIAVNSSSSSLPRDSTALWNARLRKALSTAYHHVADVDADGDLNAALDNYRRSLALRQSLETEFPEDNDYDWSEALLLDSETRWQNFIARARRSTRSVGSLEGGERLARGNPAADAADLTYAMVQVGNMLGRLGRHGEALGYYRRAESVRAASVRADGASL